MLMLSSLLNTDTTTAGYTSKVSVAMRFTRSPSQIMAPGFIFFFSVESIAFGRGVKGIKKMLRRLLGPTLSQA